MDILSLEGSVSDSASELDEDSAMYTEHGYSRKNQHMYFFPQKYMVMFQLFISIEGCSCS